MSVGLNGTVISGGNFYSVAGNVNQVFDSHAPRLKRVQGRRRLAAQAPQSSLVIRSQGRPRQEVGWPYSTVNRTQRDVTVQGDGSSSSYPDALPPVGRMSGESDYGGAFNDQDFSLLPLDLPSDQHLQSAMNYSMGEDMIQDEAGSPYSNQCDVGVPESGEGSAFPDALANYGAVSNDRNVPIPAMDPPQHHDHQSTTDYVENNTYCAGGDIIQMKLTSHGESGINILYRHVVMEALYDSGERFAEPACHPGTRTAILQDLTLWSIDADAEPILWFHGSAGIGKSAVAQMFAGDRHKNKHLGACFFFKRGHPKRGTWDGLVTTIAYQLVKAVPEFLIPVQKTIEDDKLIVGRSIPTQFQRLLVEPFRGISNLRLMPVVVLDGLDECADRKHQQQILRLFIAAIQAGQLPIRLFIASRPEPQLREVLEAAVIVPSCRQTELSVDDSAYTDIKIYLEDEFRRIHSEFTNRGVDLGKPWPPVGTLEQLVRKSSGIFIYATTVIRFIDDDYCHPADRLASVMALDPDSTAPLDDLYTQILSVLPQQRSQLRILHLIVHRRRDLLMDPEEIDLVFDLSRSRTRLMLRGLHSLLEVPPISTLRVLRRVVEPLHASFSDYLRDSRRSGKWCITDPSLQMDLVKSVIHFLSNPAYIYHKSLRRVMVYALPKLLRDVIPSDNLIGLLRNTYFQGTIFLSDVHQKAWPQKDSLYPADLIQLWVDHSWVADLARQLSDPKPRGRGSPSFRFDSIYETIFSQYPDALLLVRVLVFNRYKWRQHFFRVWDLIDVLGFSLMPLKPFIVLRDLGYSSFQEGDSPGDFLQDPGRAKGLYASHGEILNQWMLMWVRFSRQSLDGNNLDSLRLGLDLIQHCMPNTTILHELESIDLAEPCRQTNVDREAHRDLHHHILDSDCFHNVVHWLSQFPKPSVVAIALWKRQLADVKRCEAGGEPVGRQQSRWKGPGASEGRRDNGAHSRRVKAGSKTQDVPVSDEEEEPPVAEEEEEEVLPPPLSSLWPKSDYY
ncbi:hypothetical protein B0H11DRAFT_2192176 [Mycena galericulata]|nr:hypothetical protein B0H11DRAFT_2192176 [Mycena galericulata]